MKVDIALVGGGLANGLIALRLLQRRPEARLVLIERAPHLGGNHVWSFHEADLTPSQREWVAPLIARSWTRHEVRFPELSRCFQNGYNSMTSASFHEHLSESLGERLLPGRGAKRVEPDCVVLEDGARIEADVVIDGRGWSGGPFDVAWQKFVGLHVELERPHDLTGPILMDATVEQIDGFRFLYTLPFSETELLLEDTRYSDGAELDRETMRAQILDYAERMGWCVATISGEEHGVLPIVLGGDIESYWKAATPGLPLAGMRAALFQPTTGYSVPQAVDLADRIAASGLQSSGEVFNMIRALSVASWRRHGYFRFLNRMLFRAAEPKRRWYVMQTFYKRPADLIQRFYADRLTLGDRMRILSGRPPVSPLRALRCLRESSIGLNEETAHGGAA